jgi:hypothetical protein
VLGHDDVGSLPRGVLLRGCGDGRPGESCEGDAEPGQNREHGGEAVAELEVVEEAAD